MKEQQRESAIGAAAADPMSARGAPEGQQGALVARKIARRRAGGLVDGEGAAEGQATLEHESARHLRIVPRPAVAVAVPGTRVSYSLERGEVLLPEGAYYGYRWECVPDPQARGTGGAAELDDTREHACAVTWGLLLGTHTVRCHVSLYEKGLLLDSTIATHVVDHRQTVRGAGAVLGEALGGAAQGPDPQERLDALRAYQGALLAAEKQAGSRQLDPRFKEGLGQQLGALEERMESTAGRARHPLRAAHLSQEDARLTPLQAFVARRPPAAGTERWVLVDVTNPQDRRLCGEYEGSGRSPRDALLAAVRAFQAGNRYPAGRLRLQLDSVPGAELDQEIATDGASFWDSIAEFFGQVGFWAGLGAVAAGVVTAIAPEPAVSKAASALIWTSILAGTTSASINLIQRHAEGMSSPGEDALDALTIAGNLLGGAWVVGARVTGLGAAGARMQTAVVIGRIGADAAQGVLLGEAAFREYQKILAEEPDPKRRTDRLLQMLGSAATSGALLMLSMKGNRADLDQLGVQGVSLGRLGQKGQSIDLSAPKQTVAAPKKEAEAKAAQAAAAKIGDAGAERPRTGSVLKVQVGDRTVQVKLGALLGEGGNTLVYAAELDGKQVAVRVRRDDKPETVTAMQAFIDGQKPVEGHQLPFVSLLAHGSDYAIVERLQFGAHDKLGAFMEHLQKIETGGQEVRAYLKENGLETKHQQMLEFIAQTRPFKKIGDFAPDHVTYVEGRGWVLYDYSANHQLGNGWNIWKRFTFMMDSYTQGEIQRICGAP